MTLEPSEVAVATDLSPRSLIRVGGALGRLESQVDSSTSHFQSGSAIVRGGMDYEVVKYEVADGVAMVTLNNPEKRNMLSGQMLVELVDALKAARDSDDVRAVVLTGAGDKAFCAGADLGGFAVDAPLVAKHFATDLFLEFFRLMPRLGKPSLCAANGHVLAGGMGLALSCDLVIAKEGATFGTPEINVGAFPYMIMAIIYRNVPRKKVNEMMLLGERLSAEQAVEYGLANKVVPAEEFDAAVADWAQKLASKSPVLMRLGHDAMYRQQDMAVDEALEYLRSQLSLTFSTEDIVEGVSAFFEKREPQWKGR
jgi:enoyl-CoA hydratase/carnithine racemase